MIDAIILSYNLNGKNLFNIGSDNVKSLKETFKALCSHAGYNGKLRSLPKLLGIFCLKICHFFNLISLGPYHQRMLVSNIVLDTDRIKKKLKWIPKYTNEKMLIECYQHSIKTINENKKLTASKKLPNLKIIKIMKYLSF